MMLLPEGAYLGAVVRCLNEAQASIDACFYEWAWYSGQRTGTVQDISRAVCVASRRGVKVRVLLNQVSPGMPLSRMNRQTAKNLVLHGADVRFAGTAKTHHAKFWVFDRAAVILGSHNLSRRSVQQNGELSVLLDDLVLVGEAAAYFDKLWISVPGALDGA